MEDLYQQNYTEAVCPGDFHLNIEFAAGESGRTQISLYLHGRQKDGFEERQRSETQSTGSIHSSARLPVETLTNNLSVPQLSCEMRIILPCLPGTPTLWRWGPLKYLNSRNVKENLLLTHFGAAGRLQHEQPLSTLSSQRGLKGLEEVFTLLSFLTQCWSQIHSAARILVTFIDFKGRSCYYNYLGWTLA